VELGQLQAQGQPLRPQRLPEHGDRVAGRLPLRLGWQGRTGHALGPQRQQAPVHFGQRGQHQCPVLLAEQILALRCHWQLHQNLGKFFFTDCPIRVLNVYYVYYYNGHGFLVILYESI